MSREERLFGHSQAVPFVHAAGILALMLLHMTGCTPGPAPSGVVDTDGDTGVFCSLALDPLTDYPIIVYTADLGFENPSVLRYARWSGILWNKSMIDNYGQREHLSVDSGGNPHVIYYGFEDRWGGDGTSVAPIYMKYATWNTIRWDVTEPISANPVSAMIYPQESALDGNQKLHAIYVIEDWIAGTATLYYSSDLRSDETHATQIHVSHDLSITEASLALDPVSGYPRVCFFDGLDSIVYAAFDGESWTEEPIDTAEYIGWDNDLAIDSHGRPMISYADSENRALKFATYQGDAWLTGVVDQGINPGDSSIAVGNDGQPRIAYHDYESGALRIAHRVNENWNVTTLETEGDVGRYCSLALDSKDRVRLVYYNASIGKLLYYAQP